MKRTNTNKQLNNKTHPNKQYLKQNTKKHIDATNNSNLQIQTKLKHTEDNDNSNTK